MRFLKTVVFLVLPLFLLGSKSSLVTSITVTSPSGGDYIHGETINIAWTPDMDFVDIELWKDGARDRVLADNASYSGSMSWTIPTNVEESLSANYQIKVFEVEGQFVYPPDKSQPPYMEYSRTGSSDASSSFKIVPEALTVTLPTSSTSKREGNNLGISWKKNYSSSGNVDIVLMKGGTAVEIIVFDEPDYGSFTWPIPLNTLQEGNNYQVEVIDGSYSDLSEPFSITTNELSVSSYDNKSVSAGDSYSFSWNHNLNSGTVRIDYQIDGGDWKYLDGNIGTGTTSYTWDTPNEIGTARIRIRGEDELDYVIDFIDNIELTPEITVSAPSGDPFFKKDTMSVSWSSNYYIEYVDVLLLKDGVIEYSIINDGANNESVEWEISSTVDASNSANFQVKVYALEREWIDDPHDEEPGYYQYNRTGVSATGSSFQIIPQDITITSPSSSDNWKRGESYDIAWDADIRSDNVLVQLVKDSGLLIKTLTGNTQANDNGTSGSWEWEIPTDNKDIPGNESYKIRITSADGVVIEESDPFTIIWEDYAEIFEPGGTVDYPQPGQTIAIRWATNVENVDVKLEGASGTSTIASNYSTTTSPPDNKVENSIDWTVPTNQEGQYRILISGGDVNQYSGFFQVGKGVAHKTVSYDAYDANGNVTKATNANGQVIRMYYGTNSQPKTQSGTVNGAQGVYLTGIRKEGTTNLDQTAVYDALGQVQTITAPNGNTQTFFYDGLGRLEETQNDSGQIVAEYMYTTKGSNFSVSNPNWIQTKQHTGSATRYVTEYIDGLGRTIQSQQRVGTDDIVSTTTYDEQGRKHKAYKAYQKDTNHGYDGGFDSNASDFYTGITGSSTPYSETQYEDSPLDRPIKMIPMGGSSTSGLVSIDYDIRSWNGNNYKVTTTTDESGKQTETWTDAWGRKVKTVAAPGTSDVAVTIFEYDELDNLTKVTVPNGTETTYNYNPKGQLVSKTSEDAGTVQHQYDEAGNLRFSQDANQTQSGDVIFKSYDNQGRPIAQGLADANFAELDGDTTYSFESQEVNLKGIWAYDTKPSTSSYPWNDFSSLIDSKTVANPKGQVVARAWRYGGSGISESATIEGVGIVEDETYKVARNIDVSNTTVDSSASLTLESGDTITLNPGFHAEKGSQLNASIDPNLSSAASEGVSSLTGSNLWQMELYSYDDEGRMADKWIWTGDRSEWDTHLAYEYNRLGDINKRTVTVDSQTLYQFYEYNQRGLLSKVFVDTVGSKPSTAEVTYTYTATGGIDNIDYKGSKDADYAYTIRDWVKSINNVASPGGNFAADYNYFDNGNVEKVQFHNPQNQISGHNRYHQTFTYDGLNRLKSADYGYGASSSSPYFDVSGLDYDAAGNITDLQRNDDSGNLIDNLSYSYSGSNRLQSVTDAVGLTSEPWDAETVNSFGYDANGNLTSQSGKLDDVAYEHRNLPTQFSLAEGDTVIANYNADGQRILKELKGGAWSFYVMDGQQTLAVIDENGFSHFNLVGNSTFGRWEPGGTRRYYITDHLGSTRAVVDNNGNVLETFDYYPFGLLMPKRNTAGANTIEKFTGKERDTEGGLNLDYFGARYYDAALGRWQGVDPLAKKYPEWSPYNYTMNNPLNMVDPDGQSVECCLLNDVKKSYNQFKSNVKSWVNNFGNEIVNNPEAAGRIGKAANELEGTEVSAYANASAGVKLSKNASVSAASVEFEVAASMEGSDVKGTLSGPELSMKMFGMNIDASSGSINTDGEYSPPSLSFGGDNFSISKSSSGGTSLELYAKTGPASVGARVSKPEGKDPGKGMVEGIMEFIRASMPRDRPPGLQPN